jgi:hypothetical protein
MFRMILTLNSINLLIFIMKARFVFCEVQGEVDPANFVQAYRGSIGIASPILNLGTRWK